MQYNKETISKLSQELATYEFFEQHGSGTMEDPILTGKLLFTIEECTEIDAWVLSESTNIGAHGLIHLRSSWGSPMIKYRVKQSKPNTNDTTIQKETSSD